MKTEANVLLRETLARDLRYWEIRKSTAEVVPPPETDKVSFGSTVTIQRKSRTQTFRIVGVDEADTEAGLVSWISPVAKALLKASATQSLGSQLQLEAEAFARCAAGPDFGEGVQAFLARRKPLFNQG